MNKYAYFGEYEYVAPINRDSGEAEIIKVRDIKLRHYYALRVLKKSINSEEDETYQSFIKECEKLVRVGRHNNIVTIYKPRFWKEPGEEEGKAYVEMEFVEGKDLLKHLGEDEQSFIPIEDVLRMAEQISSALAFCHVDVYKNCMTSEEKSKVEGAEDEEKKKRITESLIKKYRVVHNDIHSNNIMRREDGDYVLLDFGLAFDGTEVVRSSKMEGGVEEFMAPEKLKAKQERRKLREEDLTPQLDIYGFGVVLYEYLAGQLPKDCHDNNSIEQSIYNSRKQYFEKKYPGKKYTKDYPDWLVEVIIICLRKDPTMVFEDGKGLHDYIVDHLKETKEGGVIISHDSDKDKDTDTGEGKGKGNNKKWLGIIILLLLGCIGIYYRFIRENEPAKVIIKVESVNDSLGTVRGAGTYSRGDTITIEAIAKEGCKFVVWNDENTDSIRKVVADQDTVYVAQFDSISISKEGIVALTPAGPKVPETPQPPKFMIKVKTANPNMGTVKGGGEYYDSLTVVTIEAIANTGFQFDKWNDGCTRKQRKVVATKDYEYIAVFWPLEPNEPPMDKGVLYYDFGHYEGRLINGIPGGKGVMYYDCDIQIARHDTDAPAHYAEKGDYYDGYWVNGDIQWGKLFDKAGKLKERIHAPDRVAPYDLNNEKCLND